MMNHTSKSRCSLRTGESIQGKWHRNRYTILKQLGAGANGIVYLAQSNTSKVALKMSDNGMSITSEVNVLKSFAKVQGSALGPSLLDVDDWKRQDGNISFYVMEYIEGPDLLTFLANKGRAWTSVLILQLLSDLEKLHQSGWVFGDLKPENLIVSGPPPKIRCIDVGGTTLQGRAIKEFTEFFDRGYWGLGTRKADPAYDLFAVAMVILNSAYPKRFQKQAGGLLQLMDAVKKKPELWPYEAVIEKALKGQYRSAAKMRTDLLESMKVANKKQPVQPVSVQNTVQKPNIPAVTRRSVSIKKHKGRIETLAILSVVAGLYFLYIFSEVL